jgi:uncharacterized protein YjbI with pentapeptide repeats
MNKISRRDFIPTVSQVGPIKDQDFTGIDLSGFNISNLMFENCIFTGAGFENAKLISVCFQSCKMKKCRFKNTTMEDVYFYKHSTLDGSTMEGCGFDHLVSHATIASELNIINCEFENSTFIHTSLQGSFLKNVKFEKTFFQMVFLPSSELDCVTISNSVIQHIDIVESDIKNSLIEFCLYSGFDVKAFRGMENKIKKMYES